MRSFVNHLLYVNFKCYYYFLEVTNG